MGCPFIGDLGELPLSGPPAPAPSATTPDVALGDLGSALGHVGLDLRVGAAVDARSADDLTGEGHPKCQAWGRELGLASWVFFEGELLDLFGHLAAGSCPLGGGRLWGLFVLALGYVRIVQLKKPSAASGGPPLARRCSRGPYWFWTRKVNAKTLSRVLSAEQVADYRSWSDADRHLRALVHELEALAISAVESDPCSPHRAPPPLAPPVERP